MDFQQQTKGSDERSQQLAALARLLHVAGVVPLVLGLAVYYFAYRAPLSAKEKQLAEHVASVETELRQAGAIRLQVEQTAQELERQTSRAADVRERIPDQANVAEFLRSLSEAAGKSGVLVQDFSRGDTERSATFSQVDVNLECEGTYEDICRFLNLVEHIPRVMRVMSMDIADAVAEDRCPLVLVIRLYFDVHSDSAAPRTTWNVPLHDRRQEVMADRRTRPDGERRASQDTSGGRHG